MEPIHVHVAKGQPMANATKIWLTKRGGCLIANNNSKIPEKELRNIVKAINDHYFYIISEWKEHFRIEDVKFYC